VKTPTFSNEFISSILNAVRVRADSKYHTAECAILVRSDLKGHGWLLIGLMIAYECAKGLQSTRV
jgi:acetyltransferase